LLGSRTEAKAGSSASPIIVSVIPDCYALIGASSYSSSSSSTPSNKSMLLSLFF